MSCFVSVSLRLLQLKFLWTRISRTWTNKSRWAASQTRCQVKQKTINDIAVYSVASFTCSPLFCLFYFILFSSSFVSRSAVKYGSWFLSWIFKRLKWPWPKRLTYKPREPGLWNPATLHSKWESQILLFQYNLFLLTYMLHFLEKCKMFHRSAKVFMWSYETFYASPEDVCTLYKSRQNVCTIIILSGLGNVYWLLLPQCGN